MIILTPRPAFTPMQYSPGFWVDMNDPLGNGSLPSNLTALATIVDKTGIHTPITQGTSSQRAVFTHNVQNGLPGLLFNGSTNSRYYPCSVPLLAQCNSNTIFTVGMATGSPNTRRFLIENIGTPTALTTTLTVSHEYSDLTPNSSRVFMNNLAGAVATINVNGSAIVLNTPYIYRTTYNGTVTNSFNFVRNGVSQGTANVTNALPTLSNAGFNIGCYRGADSRFFHGYIFEIICFSKMLPAAQIAEIENYLSYKWGIPI